MLYLIQITMYSAAMMLIYVFVLKNKTVFRLSRIYLLLCAFLPLLIPFVRLPESTQTHIRNISALHITLPEVFVSAGNRAGTSLLPGIIVPQVLYGLLVMVFLIALAMRGIKIRQVIRSHDRTRMDGYTLITSCGFGPGSFGRYVFFPGNDVDKMILKHEQAHIRYRHSADLVAIELLRAIVWPNIVLIWIRKELQEIHEFQADAYVDMNRQEYAGILLRTIFDTPVLPIMHLFNVHPLKRRITMLQKIGKDSLSRALLLTGAALTFLILFAVFFQSCDKKSPETSSGSVLPDTRKVVFDTVALDSADRQTLKSALEANETITPANPKMAKLLSKFEKLDKDAKKNGPQSASGYKDANGIYNMAEVMPKPAADYNAYLAQKINYPKYARDHNIEGRVIVRFVIDEAGNIRDPEIMKSPDSSLSNEALRVLLAMPAWTPGRQNGQNVPVYFVAPIVFKLQ